MSCRIEALIITAWNLVTSKILPLLLLPLITSCIHLQIVLDSFTHTICSLKDSLVQLQHNSVEECFL
ncbi:hypothetical protein Y1Q_0014473 [Alligator mississippiensis]|uniref:Uncharacterized protein n=1 Tax=Alligator mississippiensis TaxID=8496 RepID=A0A151PCR4_ALLMI|nr:hypothetical protein Y1Q_0014473 [Alligator mississippiensis]